MDRVSPEQAADRFSTTDSMGMPLATGQPGGLLEAMAGRDDWVQLRVYGALLAVNPELFSHPGVHYLSGFYGPMERTLRDQEANISFAPADFRQFGPLFRRENPRVMATMATPPDDDGWCSLSLHAGGIVPELARAADDDERMLVVEVSDHFPRTIGVPPDHRHAVHVDQIDLLVESDHAPLPLPSAEAGQADRQIAEYAREYICEGATLQTGIGAIPSTIAALLAGGEVGDFGVHSEMFTDGLMKMHLANKVTNRKGQFDGVSVTTFAAGSQELYNWLDGNQEVAFLPVEVVNSPEAISANRNMVTINGALAVDIHGQVMADTIDGRQHSGIGGHEDFIAGPALALDQRALLCMHSTVEIDGQTRSRIHSQLPAGTVITTPRHQVDVIVTEYGAAELQGKTVHQRGKALAAIAHPDFRDELLEAAERASKGRSPAGDP